MLSASEIVELEKKVSRYRTRRMSFYVVYLICFLAILCASLYAYLYFNTNSTTATIIQEKNETAPQVIVPNPITAPTIPLTPTTTSSEQISDDKILTADENETTTASNETLELHLPIIQTSKVKSQAESLTAPKEEELPKQVLMRKPLDKPEETFYRGNDERIDSTMLAPPSLLTDDNVKSKITIETQEINSVQYLKDKFEKTHNIIFAIMLAEENYLNKNYNESIKWALMANSIDAQNEKSWLWFAKSKMKLGKKDDAITALKAFLKNSKSNAAESLLNQISIGNFNE